MSVNGESHPDKSVPQWENLKGDLDVLDQLYTSGKHQDNFEYELINISKKII